MRWVDNELAAHEEFIGLYEVKSIESISLVHVIKDTFVRLNLPLSKLRGQCYDGASNMKGARNGVAKRIQDEEPRSTFIHCYGHSLNLSAKDTIQNCKILKSALETAYEITKLVKFSPRRENIFKSIKDEIEPGSVGIRTLCPTRWTVRADAMQSIIKNYKVLQELWEQAADVAKDTETVARIQGVSSQMKTFEFFFGLVFGEMLLRHADNLSRTLQKPMSASEGRVIADMTKQTLQGMRSDENFGLFWEKVKIMINDIDVAEPLLPRKRKMPKRYEVGSAPSEFPACPKDYYRRIYFEGLDLIIQSIAERFEQPGYLLYQHLQELLIKAIKKEDFTSELEFVCTFYGSDLNPANLEMQLKMLSKNISDDRIDIFDVKKYFQSALPAVRSLFNEVVLILKLILVLPATNAASERSFSAMKRILRSTMGQERLNGLMVLHVHKEMTDELVLPHIGNDFVSKCPRRLEVFGKF